MYEGGVFEAVPGGYEPSDVAPGELTSAENQETVVEEAKRILETYSHGFVGAISENITQLGYLSAGGGEWQSRIETLGSGLNGWKEELAGGLASLERSQLSEEVMELKQKTESCLAELQSDELLGLERRPKDEVLGALRGFAERSEAILNPTTIH